MKIDLGPVIFEKDTEEKDRLKSSIKVFVVNTNYTDAEQHKTETKAEYEISLDDLERVVKAFS
jgi:hypothetical protein